MKLRSLLSIAVSLALVANPAFAGTRPHYGGTLRVQSRDSVSTLDQVWIAPNSVLKQQLADVLFDRLTQTDSRGVAHPSLAVSWVADGASRAWSFKLRTDVHFADDSLLQAQDVASALSKIAPQWQFTAISPQTIMIETDVSTPNLPALLALPEFSVVKTGVDHLLIGTGPFRIETFQAARRIVLAANDDYWGGRPYLDKVEITMSGSVREELINRRLDVDDVAELSLDQARTIGYGSQSTSSGNATQRLAVSQPSDLYALVFFRAPATAAPATSSAKNPADDPRIREAIALTIDRTAISHVLLQRQAEAAPALLPQWMTGYEFLFNAQPDLERAGKLRADAVRNTPVSIPLAYDASDNAARSIAERIAVNAREANITLQTVGEKNLTLDSANNTGAQVVLVRLPLSSPAPAAALVDLDMRASQPPSTISQAAASANSEAAYAAERAALENFRIIPIAHVPQIYWLNPRVRDWTIPNSGGWRLQDVWVEGERPVSSPAAFLR